MNYFLGVDVGGTKTHALIADESGKAIGFASSGPGNWEAVGYQGLTHVLLEVTARAAEMVGITVHRISGAGMGIAGYDWPSERQAHLESIHPLGLECPLEIVNDATLGILAGSREGWGISIVAGTGCNCRGWSKDKHREGRVVGGTDWSGESVGATNLVKRAMRAVTFEWDLRGPATALTPAFIKAAGAKNLDDWIEGMYTGKYRLSQIDVRLVFKVAGQADPAALEVIRWAGRRLGHMACGVIRQLNLEGQTFDVVLIGSLFDGHPLMAETVKDILHEIAPGARLVRLTVPPVVGGVILGMQEAGIDTCLVWEKLIASTDELLKCSVP